MTEFRIERRKSEIGWSNRPSCGEYTRFPRSRLIRTFPSGEVVSWIIDTTYWNINPVGDFWAWLEEFIQTEAAHRHWDGKEEGDLPEPPWGPDMKWRVFKPREAETSDS